MPSDWFAAALYFGVAADGPDEEWLAAIQGIVHASLAGLSLLFVVVVSADAVSRVVSAPERLAVLLAAGSPWSGGGGSA